MDDERGQELARLEKEAETLLSGLDAGNPGELYGQLKDLRVRIEGALARENADWEIEAALFPDQKEVLDAINDAIQKMSACCGEVLPKRDPSKKKSKTQPQRSRWKLRPFTYSTLTEFARVLLYEVPTSGSMEPLSDTAKKEKARHLAIVVLSAPPDELQKLPGAPMSKTRDNFLQKYAELHKAAMQARESDDDETLLEFFRQALAFHRISRS